MFSLELLIAWNRGSYLSFSAQCPELNDASQVQVSFVTSVYF
jgi:hypothetical protein